jgi:phage tail-like protein
MAKIEGQWPIGRFYYLVTIGGEEFSFQEVTGLEVEAQVMEYRHGDSEFFTTMKKPGLIKTPMLVCKKGIFEDDEELSEFLLGLQEEKEFYEFDDGLEILVELLNETGETVKTWSIEGAVPVKYSTPGLNSTSNEVAVEEITFAYERITITADG